jgi:hypothetical protein
MPYSCAYRTFRAAREGLARRHPHSNLRLEPRRRGVDPAPASVADLLEAGQEVEIDPADHYIVNARSTVVLFAQQPKAKNPARREQPAAAANVTA